jgi:hypothetical protein
MKKNKINCSYELPRFVQKALIKLDEKMIAFSNYLQRKTNDFSSGRKKLFLLFFSFVVVCECTILIFCSLQNNGTITYTVSPIKIIPLIKQRTVQPMLSDKELRQIQEFKFYLDSLRAESRDSLFKVRPHLADSMEFLETIYQKQLKK